MKYVGIDYGAKRVGIAVSDDDGGFAFPRAVVSNDKKLLSHITNMIREENIGEVVIGDARTVSGSENPITKEVQEFADVLSEEASIPVTPAWEGWSSVEASRYAPKGSEHDDSAAAAIILQRFLDMRKS